MAIATIIKPLINKLRFNRKLIIVKGIYAITPNQVLALDAIEHMLNRYQPYALQYRHKTDDQALKLAEAKALKQLCSLHNTVFIINDDINLAQKVGADGVHLGQEDGNIAKARAQLGDQALIGASCYNQIELALQAQAAGADYVAFGALFASPTKPEAVPCSLETITQAKTQLQIPIVGIGGITLENQQQALTAGCDAVAMITALYE